MYLQAIGKSETPDTLNKNLQDHEGFQAGTGLLIWSVFASLYGLKQFYLSPRYDGPLTPFAYAKIRELLDNKMPVLTEIDFNPSQQGEQMHYIQIIGYDDAGNYYANDPWSGTQINVNVYGSMDTSVYQFRTYDKPVQGSTEVDVTLRANAFDDIANMLNEPHNPDIVKGEVKKLMGLEDIVRQKDAEITSIQEQATQLRTEVTDLKTRNEEFSKENTELKAKVATSEQQITSDAQKIDELIVKVDQLTSIQPIESYSGWALIGRGLQKVLRLG
jgi:hypothetical protein